MYNYLREKYLKINKIIMNKKSMINQVKHAYIQINYYKNQFNNLKG